METIPTALKEMGIPGMDIPAFIPLIISSTGQKEKKKKKGQRLTKT